MLTFQDFAETVYERFTRTISWGDTLLGQCDVASTPVAPLDLVCEIDDWTESTAFFVNFITDGDADAKLLTLDFDPRRQEPTLKTPSDIARLRGLLSMRCVMLRKWFDELLEYISEADTQRFGILNALDQVCGVPVSRVWLQEQVELETPTFDKHMDYLQHQRFIEYDTEAETVTITSRGRDSLRTLNEENKKMSAGSGTRDLVFSIMLATIKVRLRKSTA